MVLIVSALISVNLLSCLLFIIHFWRRRARIKAALPNMTGLIGVNRRMVARAQQMSSACRELHTASSSSQPRQPKVNNTTMEGTRERHELYHGTVEVSEDCSSSFLF